MTNMIPSLKSILIAIPTIVILDFVWIGWLMKPFYHSHLRPLLNLVDGKLEVRLIPMILTYVVMILIIISVALPLANAYAGDSGWAVLAIGALTGILVYGLYNLTNLTLLKDWDLTVTIVDTLWGAVIFGLSTWIVWKFV